MDLFLSIVYPKVQFHSQLILINYNLKFAHSEVRTPRNSINLKFKVCATQSQKSLFSTNSAHPLLFFSQRGQENIANPTTHRIK
jgi:hypothetical protein